MNAMDWKSLQQHIIDCRQCPRLVAWREQVALEKRAAFRDQEYWGRPVPGFGDLHARVMVVGLAPGAHGSNRTGRMFTGDASGDFLYPALHRTGFCSQPSSLKRGDGLELKDIFISAVGRCAPPQNKPTRQELMNCRPFLLQEIELLPELQGFVALGGIAFHHLLEIMQVHYGVIFPTKPKFAHGAFYHFPHAPWLLASYHPSRQNTQTGRLTEEMFEDIWTTTRAELNKSG